MMHEERKKNSADPKKNSDPPTEFNSAPGEVKKRGRGAERERGRNI